MRQFLTPRWLLRHALVCCLVAAFLGLGWWQIRRAEGGNTLSYGYAVEWPVFAIFVIFVWLREVRAELRGEQAAPPPEEHDPLRAVKVPVRRTAVAEDAEADPSLRAYNDYLAWLKEHPHAKPGDYPGR